jgi:hypothetical protein
MEIVCPVEPPGGVQELLAALDSGLEPEEGALMRALRSPSCPGALVERVAAAGWAMGRRRVLPLLLRHRACPRPFAWDALPRLGWNDLLGVVRDPRTAPPIRQQAERKLRDRLPRLTLGERVSLARLAPRGLIPAFADESAPECVQALLDNPSFTAVDAVRFVVSGRSGECVLAVVRHPRWGRLIDVALAGCRSRLLPLGVALGLVAALSDHDLTAVSQAPDVRTPVRAAAEELLHYRRRASSDE